MNLSKLKRFAQETRKKLISQIGSRLDYVLSDDDSYLRAHEKEKNLIKERLEQIGRNRLLDQVAYTWFNRIGALLYMDNRHYNRTRIVSPAEGESQPELLSMLKRGEIPDGVESVKNTIFGFLDGRVAAEQPDREAYKTAMLAYCNHLGGIMPFLFKKVDDWAALLLPADLLSSESIIFDFQQNITSEDCKDIEIIGWLYQFYISEKKDEVFAELKKNIKISPENIPAATQLFTPHWIVRYLVENSLGRLWMLNRPESSLVERMDYYIKPEEAETDSLKISSPEEIKICDPACGSGHMLVYAFDLLFAMYEEEGYTPADIPELIITRNLYGIEIDERAGELAAFALTMKAREKDRRFLERNIQPNICVLENISLEESELKDYMDFIGKDLFTALLLTTLRRFEEADNFGSLIRPEVTDVEGMLKILGAKNVSEHLFLNTTHQKVLQALKQADYLSPKYHVVVANPPYMGGKGMNEQLRDFAKNKFPDSKSDLFAMFIERNLELAQKQGSVAMITMQSWMFLSSYEKLRSRLIGQNTILSMAHLGARAFDSIGGEVVSTTSFVIEKARKPEYKGAYLRLIEGSSEAEKEAELRAKRSEPFRASAADFKKIPGSPIAYSLSDTERRLFLNNIVAELGEQRLGIQTGDNDQFLRHFHELEFSKFIANSDGAILCQGTHRWVPINKGGDFRKWYGNKEFVINWECNGRDVKAVKKRLLKEGKIERKNSRCWNEEYYFLSGISWSRISSGNFGCRLEPKGAIFETASPTMFFKNLTDKYFILGLYNSVITKRIVKILSPTLTFQSGDLQKIPLPYSLDFFTDRLVKKLVDQAQSDWDSYETSWDFTYLPLLGSEYRRQSLLETYTKLRTYWGETTLEMQRLEEENNRIFIDAYSLTEELMPDVPLEEITLTCNPWYRYGKKCNHQEQGTFPEDSALEGRIKADTIREYISYAVGCLFGRYSLDKPGLVLANAGDGIKEYYQQIPQPTFLPDESGILPLTEEDYFTDDLPTGARKFIRISFGEERYEENLRFIEDALGKNLRTFLLKDFYKDHVKRYKKRPIYWQVTSPSGIFRCLIYLHRYTPETVGQVLNGYIRPYIKKLEGRISHGERMIKSGTLERSEEAKTRKNIDRWRGMVGELTTWERDVVYPLATERIVLDLDDGVKVNYGKLGAILTPIKGLNS
ncbi:MAG: BREX-1 system adenine-specific DNA-methyltransferase PglX [Planctomycetes bacterium]|nr:BREX-1 system adenine-specific DNA-methyltransferase PglX [Planctomycetota bacterium]